MVLFLYIIGQWSVLTWIGSVKSGKRKGLKNPSGPPLWKVLRNHLGGSEEVEGVKQCSARDLE